MLPDYFAKPVILLVPRETPVWVPRSAVDIPVDNFGDNSVGGAFSCTGVRGPLDGLAATGRTWRGAFGFEPLCSVLHSEINLIEPRKSLHSCGNSGYRPWRAGKNLLYRKRGASRSCNVSVCATSADHQTPANRAVDKAVDNFVHYSLRVAMLHLSRSCFAGPAEVTALAVLAEHRQCPSESVPVGRPSPAGNLPYAAHAVPIMLPFGSAFGERAER